MGDVDNPMPPSKKSVASKQLSRDDDPDCEEEVFGQETGTFKRASDEVLASRRIVKVHRNTTSSTRAANPFAGLRLVSPTAPPSVEESEAKTSETTLYAGADGRPPVAQEEGASEARDNHSDGKNNNEVMSVSETKVDDTTLTEAKKVCQTKSAEADLTVNSGGEVKGKEGEAQLEPAEATKENGEQNKNGESESQLEPAEATKENREQNKNGVSESTEKTLEQSTEVKETNKEDSVKEVHRQEPSATVNSFQQLSRKQNAFAGISGTGFSSSSFSFGFLSKSGTSSPSSFGSAFSSRSLTGKGALFETKAPGSDGLSPSSASNGGASIRPFGAPASDNVSGSVSGLPALQEVPVETGEEKEKAVFTPDSVLFEYISGAWKERGKGELKVNFSTEDTGKARLVMRSKGNYRLILNANLFPDMKLANMDKRGITFVCMNSAGEAKENLSIAGEAKENLSMFALKFKDGCMVEQFRGVVEANKGKTSGDLKTPENSSKSSEV
ncbi:nuclear pore complex protein NUP50B-like [Cryptomeria japonica]|uniref:nuclear pore complex protein NUP50B-like n=1 Tax=Cryptomeria japonica TaxID=3369 RepID=UPI0027DA9BCB|nr:nuclear pore complex protein NUP50B-like [Cryptomeria japonica]